jgi:hypothetical protein
MNARSEGDEMGTSNTARSRCNDAFGRHLV